MPCSIALLALTSVFGLTPLPSATTIISRCQATYNASKTYQAEISLLGKRGDSQTKMQVSLKTIQGPGGKSAKSRMEFKETGLSGMHTMIVDNGKMGYSINLNSNRYSEIPHEGISTLALVTEMVKEMEDGSGLPLAVSLGAYEGHPVYVISHKGATKVTSVQIDRVTHFFLAAHQEEDTSEGHITSDIKFSHQAFNKPIPDSTFKWVPPVKFAKVPIEELGSELNSQ